MSSGGRGAFFASVERLRDCQPFGRKRIGRRRGAKAGRRGWRQGRAAVSGTRGFGLLEIVVEHLEGIPRCLLRSLFEPSSLLPVCPLNMA